MACMKKRTWFNIPQPIRKLYTQEFSPGEIFTNISTCSHWWHFLSRKFLYLSVFSTHVYVWTMKEQESLRCLASGGMILLYFKGYYERRMFWLCSFVNMIEHWLDTVMSLTPILYAHVNLITLFTYLHDCILWKLYHIPSSSVVQHNLVY